jgi:2-amino-4-hydroxy-6-hydroxymethyldihydropteridine diphosphokinase
MNPASAYIALGSNLGDRRALIEAALDDLRRLETVQVLAVSDLIETAPHGPPGQGSYLNGAAALRTQLAPRDLLETLLAVEAAHGRDRAREKRWGPRRLDLDLLLYGDLVIDEPGLTVPHPRLHERWFVLAPLANIAPAVVHPVLGITIAQLRDRAVPSAYDRSGAL